MYKIKEEVLLFLIILAGILVFNTISVNKTGENTSSTCSSDYKKCKDNADMANNYSGWFKAKYACKEKLTEIVKYGEPDFKGDGYTFSYFLDGVDYPKKGIATLIAKVAVPNEFGTKVNGEQSCEVDLDTNRVIKQYGDFNDVNGFFESEDYDAIIKSREQQSSIATNDLQRPKLYWKKSTTLDGTFHLGTFDDCCIHGVETNRSYYAIRLRKLHDFIETANDEFEPAYKDVEYIGLYLDENAKNTKEGTPITVVCDGFRMELTGHYALPINCEVSKFITK